MTLLDMSTLVFSNVITDIVCTLVIVQLWAQTRRRFAGTGLWVADFALQTAALMLIISRGSIPDWMSMVFSNSMVIAGALLGFIGLERFAGKRGPQTHNYVLLAAFVGVHSYFTLIRPDLATRSLNLSVALLIICSQCVWLLLHRVEPGMRRLTSGVGIVFGAYCLVSIVRVVEFFVGSHSQGDYLHSGPFESFILITYQMLFILLTYSLVLMVNKRLIADIQTQEERFSKAFNSSPYAITLTRLSDGQVSEVNDGFVNITGYQYADVRGKTTPDLHLWEREEDRAIVIDELSKSGKVRDREFPFRVKSGERITGLFSAEIITIDNQKFVLSSINDISARKRAEETIKAALLEKETLLKEIHHRVKNNLQVISSLLNLQCGFLHDENDRAMFQDSIDRVRTMANIHTMLYQSTDLANIDFGGLMRDLTCRLQQFYGGAESHVDISVDVSNVSLTIETAIPCGLILNELVSNALKHAFPEGKGGEIHISMTTQGGRFVLKVHDNGIGLPESVDLHNTHSLGLELVNLMVAQMNGEIGLEVDCGTTFTITFPIVPKEGYANGKEEDHGG